MSTVPTGEAGATGRRAEQPVASDRGQGLGLVDFGATLERLSTAVVVTDLTGILLYANRRAEEAFGWVAEGLVGSAVGELAGVEVAPATAVEIGTALRDGRSWHGDFELRRPDGSLVTVSVSDSGLYGTDGSLIGVVSFITDVTESRQSIERLVSEAEALRFLLDATTVVSSAPAFHECLERLATLAVPLLGDLCVIDVLAEGGVRRPVAVHADPAKAELAKRLTDFPSSLSGPDPTAQVLRSGVGLIVADLDEPTLRRNTFDDEHYALARELGLTSWMSVPLQVRGRITGALTLMSAGSGRRFGKADLQLVEDLAARVAYVVDNARALSEQAQVARSLQATLLPRSLPEIAGLQLAAAYRAAGEGLVVGGDFYDVFPAARGGWAIVIGDVSGRGADAAAVTGLVRQSMHAAGRQHRDPAAILTSAGAALLDEDGTPERFCTAACVVWQPRRPERITHASAGHPDVVLVRTNGRIDRLGAGGLPLGMFPDMAVRTAGAAVAPGDLMVLYTDGVTEARDPAGRLFGDEGVSDALSHCAGRSPEETVDTLLSAVGRHSAGGLGDDLALLVVGWQPG